MARQFQLRRGTTIENETFVGAVGELTYDVQKKEVRVHDNITPGGKVLAGGGGDGESIKNQNPAVGATNPLYNWEGTLEQYLAQDIEHTHPDWICLINDDNEGGGGGNGESISNQNKSSDITQVYDWIGTYEEYISQDVANIHPGWVCYILDDTSPVISEDRLHRVATNCILNLPQDIKLEKNDNIITLKAGSKLYMPNGFEADNITRHFDVRVIESDISLTVNQSNKLLHVGGTNLGTSDPEMWYVSDTQPTGEDLPQYYMWYDLSTNRVCYYDGTQLQVGNRTIPIGIYYGDSVKAFNGFSFAGDYLFSFPGVTVLIPDGRNPDGSLKNKIVNLNKVTYYDNQHWNGGYSAGLAISYLPDQNNNVTVSRVGMKFETVTKLPPLKEAISYRAYYLESDNLYHRKWNNTDTTYTTEYFSDCGTFSYDPKNFIITDIFVRNPFKITSQEEFEDYKQISIDTKKNMTNCLTYIPQDLKVELNNGAITLKAGSKVYIPDGFEEDGTTKKFITYTLLADITQANPAIDRTKSYLVLNSNRNTLLPYLTVDTFSSDTEPVVPSANAVWYDTANNLIKTTGDTGTTWNPGNSLPILIASSTSTTWTNIDQVFNGFGFIGSVVYALPGIKGLMANGRDEDGNLKNKEFTTNIVSTYKSFNDCDYIINSANQIAESYYRFWLEQEERPSSTYKGYWYKPSENCTYRCSTNGIVKDTICRCLHMFTATSEDEGHISKLDVFYPLRVPNYNEFSEHKLIQWVLPRASNNYTWYRLYNDGWVEQGGISTGATGSWKSITLPISMKDANYVLLGNSCVDELVYIVAFKDKTATGFQFCTCNHDGSTYGKPMSWQVSGLAAQM